MGISKKSKSFRNIFIPVKIKVTCPKCKGAGYNLVENSTPEVAYACEECNGLKRVLKNKTIDLETLKEMLNARKNTSAD